ncbi:hypothetical protein DSO57_1012960 [Entomophthora muscae]|uniref:Uncharacterized protein n=1 Tax=Entomophthora muscae TaxID=34485 RepID=A0ACC2TGQ8_9FUNG|nr:hypothetical protein DSO57_1012960 [Entomophthora muscae]
MITAITGNAGMPQANMRLQEQSMTINNLDKKEAYRRRVEDMVTLIEEGAVYKRGPRPLQIWQKRYMKFPRGHYNFSLMSLRVVHRKNLKKRSDSEEYARVNRLLFEALAAATVSAEDMIVYYKSSEPKELPQGLIYLKHVTGVEAIKKSSKANSFVVRTQIRDYVFSTKSAADAEAWVQSIQTRIREHVPDLTDTRGYQISYRQLGKLNRRSLLTQQSKASRSSANRAKRTRYSLLPRWSLSPARWAPLVRLSIAPSSPPTKPF